MKNLDQLLPLIVFLLIGLASSIAQKKQQKKAKEVRRAPQPVATASQPDAVDVDEVEEEPEPRSSPLFEQLKKRLETIGQEIQEAAREQIPVEPPPATPAPALPQVVQPLHTDTLEQTDVVLDTDYPGGPETTDINRSEISDVLIPSATHTAPQSRNQQEQNGRRLVSVDPTITRLREGVVLSEILAPPMALRNE
jgi:hypothetical protein